MKQMMCIGFALLALMGQAGAAELPRDLRDAMPRAAEELLEEMRERGFDGYLLVKQGLFFS